jgi:hypothetical protein
VIVADHDAAIRIYRGLGFGDAEFQIGFERPPEN